MQSSAVRLNVAWSWLDRKTDVRHLHNIHNLRLAIRDLLPQCPSPMRSVSIRLSSLFILEVKSNGRAPRLLDQFWG